MRIRVAPENVSLVDWPLVQRPAASALALLVAGAASVGAGWATQSVIVGLLVAGSLAVCLWRTLVPVRYEFAGGGIVQSVFGWPRRIPWTAVKSYEILDDGVLLLPDTVRTSLSPLRGLYVHWGNQREQVLSHLDYYLQSWNAAIGQSQQTKRTMP
jgi:hypothetical protein